MTETALHTAESVSRIDNPRRKKRRPLSRPVLYVVLILGAIPTILPFIWLLRSAFMSSGQIFVSPPQWIPHPWEWSNFSGALTAVTFGQRVWAVRQQALPAAPAPANAGPARDTSPKDTPAKNTPAEDGPVQAGPEAPGPGAPGSTGAGPGEHGPGTALARGVR